MTRPARPSVHQWTWNPGRPHETYGARIRTGGQAVFIPAKDLRRVADVLHDIADKLEDQEADR
ncbi:hypothetical protein [Brachybacterium sp. p3-SID957]|uniref:hypothetical protein n=1 Tax=Brachybacterium sp. p3-SID957 TaxID=2916049 RepID=UPI00223B50F7|nr:hypothetical protein [Brachybacterium sp. p3-SID957]MCT1776764.1 hypothetical protein [Brachybacterium sp. p3-SID957]